MNSDSSPIITHKVRLEELNELEKYVNDKAIFIENKYHSLMLKMAIMYNNAEKIKLKILDYEISRLLDRFPSDPILLTQKADILRMSGNANYALKLYRDALSIYPDYENALKGEIIALCELGEIEEALKKAKKLIEKDPSFAGFLMNIMFAGRRSISHLSKLFSFINKLAESGNVKVKQWLENLKKTASDVNTVLRNLAKALLLNPNAIDVWLFRGTLLRELNILHDALICFENVLDMDYLNAEAWLWKGTILMDLKLYKEAERVFLRLTRISPNFADAWIGLGRTYLAANLFNRALTCFDMAIKIDPLSYVAWQFRAYVLGLMGKKLEAKESLKIAKKIVEIVESESEDEGDDQGELI